MGAFLLLFKGELVLSGGLELVAEGCKGLLTLLKAGQLALGLGDLLEDGFDAKMGS